jgi:hypothetical protein
MAIGVMAYAIGLCGMWLMADAWYSIGLYMNAESYGGKKQTWARDHYIRVIRGVIGVFLMVAGYLCHP